MPHWHKEHKGNIFLLNLNVIKRPFGEIKSNMRKTYTAIDLFCGAGGLSEGLHQAGFSILAGNDINESAGATYSSTHKDSVFLPGPLENLNAQDFLNSSQLSPGQLDCLVGGPPCQAFSVYNHQRGMHDNRSQLFHEYLRLVEGLMPRWVMMENVTGILSAGDGVAVKSITQALVNLGYRVEYKVLRAEDYGIPQERRRVIFMGNRVGKPIHWPAVTHGQGIKPLTTVSDAISDLPPLKNGEDRGIVPYHAEPLSSYQSDLRARSNSVHNHSAPKLGSINLERMKFIPKGGSWRDIPFELLPEGMKKAKRSDHTKRYGRLNWASQSSTILTKCDLHWGAYIHPEQDRAITVREAARLQSFPDWFHFLGSKTEQYVQVGNAVPPLLGRRLGEVLLAADAMSNSNLMSAAE